jgi:hypothetical protein
LGIGARIGVRIGVGIGMVIRMGWGPNKLWTIHKPAIIEVYGGDQVRRR